MAGNFQGQFSSNLSFENSFSALTSGENETEELVKDNEDSSDNEIVIEERIVASQHEFISLEELADSDFTRNRQVAAKSIVDHLHQAGSNKEALHSVISVMCKLSEDEDLMVRSELIEQIPSIALFCKEHYEDLGVVIRQQIVPYTVKLLTDIQRQIRKTGHSILIVLLENNVIDNSQLSEWICPLVAQLVTSENIPEGLRQEDVSVMCKMIPYVGKEITEKFFLEPFLLICRDSTSSAREVCMLHFGTISQVIGREASEKTLLCAFLDICQESWHVRAKCVDIAIDLATTVSSATRNEILSPVYMSFLKDESVAVSEVAYLSLGRFISTFAEPSETGLNYKDGMWINADVENDNTDDILLSVQCHQGHSFEFLTSEIISKPKFLEEWPFKNLNSAKTIQNSDELSFIKQSSNFKNCQINQSRERRIVKERYSRSFPSKDVEVGNENIFNNFQFWKMPLPEVDLDIEECLSTNSKTDVKEENPVSIVFHHSFSFIESSPTILPKPNSKEPNTFQDINDCKVNEDGKNSPEVKWKNCNLKNHDLQTKKSHAYVLEQQADKQSTVQVSLMKKQMTDTEKMVYDQDIVPPQLLMEFINEIMISKNEVKNENLTFYFPAVAYALGRKHWPCIRDLFNTISSMFLLSVKKVVASSLHELAVILGPEITTEDLLPIFLVMLRSFSVRMESSLMKNVSNFLKKTKPKARRQFLPLIEDLCSWREDDCNWRYRLTVSEQLILCVEMFSSDEAVHFLPASLLIIQDKVSAVRRSGVELLAVIIKSIASNPKSSNFLKALLCTLDHKYRNSKKWQWRQLYVFLCQDLAAKGSLRSKHFVEEIVPNLFSLAWDAVPNVRLALARCLALTFCALDILPLIQEMHFTLLLQVFYSLQSDVDKDVRYFGHLSVTGSGIFKSLLNPEEEIDATLFKESEE